MSRKRGGLIGKGIVPDSRDASSKSASGIWNLNDVNDEIESLYPQVNVDPDVSGIVYERFNPITDVGEGQSAVNTGTGAANNHLGEFFLNTQSKVVWSGSASGDNDTIFTSADFSYSVVEIGGDATNIASFGQSGGVNGAALYMNVDANLADDTEMTFKIKVTDKYGHFDISDTYGLLLKAVVYTEATGGTITCVDDSNNVVDCSHSSADEKIHKFTGSSIFAVQVAGTLPVDWMVIASGGSGSQGWDYSGSGGGGAGGLRTSYGLVSGGGSSSENGIMVSTNTNYAVTVGAWRQVSYGQRGHNGLSSEIKQGTTTLVTTSGGGGGGNANSNGGQNSGNAGGSGGGRGHSSGVVGLGTTNEGYDGGLSGNEYSGGGGGSSEAGNTDGNGYGGDGLQIDITGINTWYAGGGSGNGYSGMGAYRYRDGGWANYPYNGGGGNNGNRSSGGIVIFRYKLPPS